MDVGTVFDLIDFCVTAVKTIIKYQAITKIFRENLEKLEVYALRLQTLTLVVKQLRNTHKLHPRLEQDTNNSVFRARNTLTMAKA